MTAELAALRRVLARTTWRFRLQRGLELAAWALAALSAANIALRIFGGARLNLAYAASALGLAWAFGMLWPSSPLAAARAVDRSAGLVGRCAAALAFLRIHEAERSPFMNAALRDAELHAQRASAAQAAPWQRPRATWVALLFTLVASALPNRRASEPRLARPLAAPASTARAILAQDDLAAYREALERIAPEASDGDVRELLARYRTLLTALAEGSLDRASATAELLELEAPLADAKAGLDERSLLRSLVEELVNVRPAWGESLRRGGSRRAAEGLAKLGRELARREVSERERQRLAAALARARERAPHELAPSQEPRLLASKEDAQASDSPERRLLEQKRRELAALRRDRPSVASAQRRKLERLTRELEMAEQALRGGPAEAAQAGEALERAAEALSQQASLEDLRQQLAQLREQLQQQQRQRGHEQRGSERQRASQGGADAGGETLAERRERFRLRAESDEREAGVQLALGQGAQTSADDGGRAKETTQREGRALALGGGAGDGAELQLPGPRTLAQSSATATGEHDERRMAASQPTPHGYDDESLASAPGEGPSRSQVIAGAARGGFARASYRKVFADYQAHAEQLLERDDVPPGYRFYVRRYFQLVRPRATEESP